LVQIGEPMIDLLAPGMPALRGVSAAAVPIRGAGDGDCERDDF
jgi:hypothetical protein